MCLYMVEKIKKGDVVIRFWYTLKNLQPNDIKIVRKEKLTYCTNKK
jgi:hypothetical protein